VQRAHRGNDRNALCDQPEVIRELNELGRMIDRSLKRSCVVPSNSVVAAGESRARRPAVRLAGAPATAPCGVRPDIRVVRRGDTLYGIAQRSVRTSIRSRRPRHATGRSAARRQKLRVGSSTLAADGAWFPVVRRIASRASGALVASNDGSRRVVYTVRRGDTLYSIARLAAVSVVEMVGCETACRAIAASKTGQTLVAFVRSRS